MINVDSTFFRQRIVALCCLFLIASMNLGIAVPRAFAQQSSAHPHLKAHALQAHAHKHAHTKTSPCEVEAKQQTHLGQDIISDKIPCPGNSMGIDAEPHIDPKSFMSKLVYPTAIKSKRKEAWVSMMVLIDEKGKYDRHTLECIKAFDAKKASWDAELSVEEIEALEASAVAALQTTTFEPAHKGGAPTKCWTRIPVHYSHP